MTITNYHAKLYAYELTRRFSAGDVDLLNSTVANAQVDLNPHQVDAALFAFKSPLSKGALLADEVGLGKTIEAGLVLAQKFAENKRRILVITPSNLRKQWFQELTEKFFLPCRILETKSYNALKKETPTPFIADEIIICSYEFARRKETDIQSIPWDIVVIDEAHRLRNVYKTSNKTATTLKRALSGRYKLLLTATPLQNSILELYGLVSFIDEYTFGDLGSFREQFSNLKQDQTFQILRNRLEPICQRTLRRQVNAYIPYTKRIPIVQDFTPSEEENFLYDYITEYLRRSNLQALPTSQRSLITLVLRKLLASSSFAIAGALATMSTRLKQRLEEQNYAISLDAELDQDYETLDELAEEWNDEEEVLTNENVQAIRAEIADLDTFIELATSIEQNAKGTALLSALQKAFNRAQEMGAAEKAIIFTESRRTQEYLLRLLEQSPYAEGIVLFNGSNDDERSRQIYTRWIARYKGTDKVTGSKTADMRSALVDYFRNEGRIMIATEAAAEGVNLQFCSLVVNYDLPWNPQRIEQRIGRCHRYGQKYDVVVVNFLNRRNAADQRVFELLSEKFKLFEGVFGASDEVLGAIESGVDFEKRIAEIYQKYRQADEIQAAFDELQKELSSEINESILRTRQQLLENFDDQVREKLRMRGDESSAFLSRYERQLLGLTGFELGDAIELIDDKPRFILKRNPFSQDEPEIALGEYKLPRTDGDAHIYRLSHPLAQTILNRAKARELPLAEIEFSYSQYNGNISTLTPLIKRSGLLQLIRYSVHYQDQAEDYLIISAVDEQGYPLEESLAKSLFDLPGITRPIVNDQQIEQLSSALARLSEQQIAVITREIKEKNAKFFEEESLKLETWADDLKSAIERDIKDLDRQIREARRTASASLSLEQKLEGQHQIKALEQQRTQKRRSLFDAQDDIERQRDALIAEAEKKLQSTQTQETLFSIRWVLNN